MTGFSYAIIPDQGGPRPAALFHDLEEAIAWALARYGSDGFRVVGRTVLASDAARPQRD